MPGTEVEVAALLADLVRVPSVNPRGRPEPAETPLAAFIADWCAGVSLPARLASVADGRCNVIAELPGQRDEWVLLETHLDTVATDGMTIPPFDPVVTNGRLYGRGACDAKASLAVFLAVLASLAADPVPPPRGVRLVGAIDEEHHYLGVTHLLDSGVATSGTTVGAVVGEPTALRLIAAHKGCMRCQIMTTGPGGHSSAPAGLANAVEIAADVVAYLRDQVVPSLARRSQQLVGAPTLAVTMISGGSGPNVLPAKCEITVDRRLVPGEEAQTVWAELKSDLESRWPGSVCVLPPFITDPPLMMRAGDPFVLRMQHHLAAAGLDPAVAGAGYGTDASKLAAAGIPAVVFGPGSIEDAHTAVESVELAQLPVAVGVLTSLLRSPAEHPLRLDMSDPTGPARKPASRPRRPTMVDVAREAGVALRTVSRVVNGDSTVGAALAERVRQAIAVLGYQPDERARQLRSGFTGTVGAAVRNISDYHPVLGSAYEAARSVGLTIVAMSTEDDEQREREAVMSMCRRRMDGIIIEPIADNHQYLRPEIDSGLTVVAFDRPATGVVVDTVLTDNRGGIGQAFEHLVQHGHGRIGYIGDDERIYTGHQRAEAFRDCLRAQGSPVESLVHPGPINTERISAALTALTGGPDPATAIVTGNASTTIAVIQLLGADYGRTSIVGFDDFPLANLLRPGLTVVAQDEARIGQATIDLLCARRADPERPIQTVIVPTMLIPRGSGETLP